MFVSKKRYKALEEKLSKVNSENGTLKRTLTNKEKLLKEYVIQIDDLESVYKEISLEKDQFKNENIILNQEVKLYQDTVKDLEDELENIKEANTKLIDVFNSLNDKLWTNKECIRQLRKLSNEIEKSNKIDKWYIAEYLDQISMYINTGLGIKIKNLKDFIKGDINNENSKRG